MDSESLLAFIKETGLRTRAEIFKRFGEEDTEIIDMHLKYLQDKSMTAKISFVGPAPLAEDLYYIPYLG